MNFDLSPDLKIGIALNPKWIHPPDPLFEIGEFARGYGVYFDLPRIIRRIRQEYGPIISVFYNPEGTDLDQMSGFKLPIRIRIELKEETNQEILEFNIYEFSNWRQDNFYLCRSAYGRYSITADAFYHIDGKALLFEIDDYHPDEIVWRRRSL